MEHIWSLQEGIKKFGVGNWSKIAKQIDSSSVNRFKCSKYVIDHYGNPSVNECCTKSIESDDVESSPLVTNSTANGDVTTSSGSKPKVIGPGCTRKERENNERLKKCGYNPFRDEFEAEWNDGAEDIICNMVCY